MPTSKHTVSRERIELTSNNHFFCFFPAQIHSAGMKKDHDELDEEGGTELLELYEADKTQVPFLNANSQNAQAWIFFFFFFFLEASHVPLPLPQCSLPLHSSLISLTLYSFFLIFVLICFCIHVHRRRTTTTMAWATRWANRRGSPA